MNALQQDSSKYLYGRPNPPGKLANDVHKQMECLNITKVTQSSTVQHHVINKNQDGVTGLQSSVSWPPLVSECDSKNGPKIMTSVSSKQTPHTAPVLARDLNPFVNETSSAQQIPNINCHSGVENSGAGSPKSTGSPSEGRRAVKVLHVPSSSKPSGVGQTQAGSYTYKIQIEDGGGVCTVLPSQASHPPPRLRFVSHPGEVSSDVVSSSQTSVSTPHVSTSNQPTHSTQKTFFINRNNSNTGQASPDRMNTNTNQYTSFNSDQHLNVQHQGFVASGHTSPVPGYSGVNQSGCPQGFQRPLFVELTSSGPEGAQTQLHYFPTSHDRSPNVNTYSNRYGGSNVPSNTPSSHYQTGASFHIPPNQNVGAGHHAQSSAYVYPHYPTQVTPTISHHGVPVQGGHMIGMESEQGNIVMQTSPEGITYYSPGIVSPASSHSSLSSESSSRDSTNQRPRSGSMQDETAYIQGENLFTQVECSPDV